MLRTLVIDNDPDTEPLLRGHAENLPAETSTELVFAQSDGEALASLETSRDFDIALVAVDRPGLAGMEVFKRIRDRRVRVPRIALTGGGDVASIRTAIVQGAVDFLVKPFSREDFAATVSRALRDVERRRRVWRERAEFSALRREIDIASEIQQRILPHRFPVVGGLDMYAKTVPAKIMCGDFFDVFELDDGKIGLIVADVAGKGVPAAFYMAVAHTLLHSEAQAARSPAECLARVNRSLCRKNIPGMFVSVFYGILDPVKRQLVFANGGHLPPCVIGYDGQPPAFVNGGRGTALGVQEEVTFEDGLVTLTHGQTLFLYTDGVTEAFDGSHSQFTERRLAACLAANNDQSSRHLAEAVFAAVADFTSGVGQHDDMTAVALRYAQ